MLWRNGEEPAACACALYYDPDGIGTKTQTQFARLDLGLGNFGAGNFIVA